MPQMLATALTPLLSNLFLGVGLPALAFGAPLAGIALGTSYIALAAGAFVLQGAIQSAITPRTEAPKPEDGKYNLKQSVPPLTYVLGRVKKAGDYAFLEETAGVAYHIMVDAAHEIQGYVQHYLHDEAVTLDGSGTVVSPDHFEGKVGIGFRYGWANSSAYPGVVAAFPGIWTNDHRGDGLASVLMVVQSVASEDMQRIYPQGMPQRSSILDGNNHLVDPRTGLAGFSTNMALFRYWHLTHPVGGKLVRDDMHDPDWSHAADVCDQNVTNRSGGVEKRYRGGLWFRANNDPVQIGRLMDQAGELVIYERPDGKVGVHAGEFVSPDIRLAATDVIHITYDFNRRRAANVLAVRGRYTDPAKGYNTADAAIYGIPYPTDDERTKTVENQAVQSHNHMARLQKLAYIRANAPRVKIVAHFEPARNVPYRRFIRVHLPPKLDEAIIEVTGRPTLSLRNMTYEFEGIVVPANLYAFNAATEEGAPGANVVPVEREDVPLPANFAATVQTEVVSGGSSAAFVLATFDLQNTTFQYEIEWVPTAGGAAQQRRGAAGELAVRSLYLADGVSYKFRARTWSADTPSAWTSYQTVVATADPTPPGVVTGVAVVPAAGQATFNWTAPNSSNYFGARIYTNTTNSFGTATLQATEYGAPSSPDSRTVTLTAGVKYGWIVSINASGVAAAAVATGSFTVT